MNNYASSFFSEIEQISLNGSDLGLKSGYSKIYRCYLMPKCLNLPISKIHEIKPYNSEVITVWND